MGHDSLDTTMLYIRGTKQDLRRMWRKLHGDNGKEENRNFCCYAREDQELLLAFRKHLKPLELQSLITVWSDIDIRAGIEWEKEIRKHLNSSQIILLFISSDFMASDYCYSTEMSRAIERHEHGEACVVPIILRPTSWHRAPFGKLQVLPTNAEPVTSRNWHTRDEAFLNVIEGIEKRVDELLALPLTVAPLPQQVNATHVEQRLQPGATSKEGFDKFTQQVRDIFTLATEEALRFQYNNVGSGHMLLALVSNAEGVVPKDRSLRPTMDGKDVASEVLANLGVELRKIRSATEILLLNEPHSLVSGELGLSAQSKEAIERAVDEACRMGDYYIGTHHLLLGLIRVGEGVAATVFANFGINLERARIQTFQALGRLSR